MLERGDFSMVRSRRFDTRGNMEYDREGLGWERAPGVRDA